MPAASLHDRSAAPMDAQHDQSAHSTAVLFSVDLDMYTEHLMAAADVLVSDYSSVILDWLLLSRPSCCIVRISEGSIRGIGGFPYFDFEQLFERMIHRDLEALAAGLERNLTRRSPTRRWTFRTCSTSMMRRRSQTVLKRCRVLEQSVQK